ncbi:hypothetical protein [Streptomyces canus]|uniref:hypothetical protein n=1 Tax=Streptomyces canus TaxID=58343 RepID=UPI00037C7606|nr:hypothetical protein [Streptomyces canus]
MDATTIGTVLASVGVLSTAVVAYIGKRGENRLSRFNSMTDQLQEELGRKTTELAAAQTEVVSLQLQRRSDLIRITQLEIEVTRLGGTIPP